ncbi:hypothetical protein ABFS82_12G045300 [Erythranthe guttata]|uniref:la-related protein 1C-like n=1 Tax=Erythranthe guttata TaxID=4155 RepID=UPI00064E0106|nr:PREDICTED: la-related protein 1C-like [Erythranthe guttata]|eukprot:XP_012828860.1 PREDICTED: la-related protein 1C-like [Erythranthe guttata]
MANSPSSAIQAQNSPRSRHQQRRPSAAARGVPSEITPPISLSGGVVDQEQFLTSSSTTASSDSYLPSMAVGTSSSSAEDGGPASQLDNSENNSGAVKKPVWNKPSNETTAAADVGVVMGAMSWPALGESLSEPPAARASPKSSSAHSLKALSVGSIPLSQELGVGSSSSPKEVNTSLSSPNLTSTHVVPARQKSMKRGGGSSSQGSILAANDTSSQVSPMQVAMVEAPSPNSGKSSVGEFSRDRDVGQRSYPFRRNNNGPQPRGDGSYHHSHGGRRDNPNRSFGNRESHAPQQRVASRPFTRGPAPSAPLVTPPPPPMRPFISPMIYTEMPSPPMYYLPHTYLDPFRPMVPVPQMHVNMPDPQLPSRILNQIDYYFSNENLVKDTFLRRNMDNEGWVSVKLIAGFKKVMQLTDNIQLILDAVQASNVVEVQGDKLRRKGDWNRWIMTHVPSQNMPSMIPNSVTLSEKAAT